MAITESKTQLQQHQQQQQQLPTGTATSCRLVQVSDPVDGVRVLAFNRPEKRNALSQALINNFLQELSEASENPGTRVVVVTGNETCFSAGADIKEISELDGTAARQRRYLEDLCLGMKAFRKPLIAAVEGMAFGGGLEIALMCDMIFAGRSSRMGLPEVSIGLIPGAGGTQRLTNALGKYRAMKMILLGAPIAASDAAAAGLVADLFDDGAVLVEALGVARKLATSSSSALSLAKEAICKADDCGREDDFERSLYYFAFGTADKEEGVGAFLEKRTPSWSR